MGKKCCKRHPPCKDCPKLKKHKKKGIATVNRKIWPIFNSPPDDDFQTMG